MTLNNSYSQYLTHKLNGVNDKLLSSINIEIADLKDNERLLQGALEIKARQDVITQIERDIEMEELRTLNKSLAKSVDFNRSLQTKSINPVNFRPTSSHTLLNYLEKDYAIEKLRTLNESINLQASLMASKQEPITTQHEMSSSALNDLMVKQALVNDNLRSHLLVHKPGEECSICSPNNIYINTLRHNTDNLRSFLKSSIKENQTIRTVVASVKPNVVFSTSKGFRKDSEPLSYSEYLKLFTNTYRPVDENHLTRPLTYDQRFYETAAKLNNSLNRSLSRSDLYDRDYDYDQYNEDTVYRQNKYSNKYHEFNSSKLPRKVARSRSLNRSYTVHDRPWSYGKVETPHYDFTKLRLSK